MGSEFCYFDFLSKKWDIGDLIEDAAAYPIHDHCSIIKIDEVKKKMSAQDKVNKFSLIVSGGKRNQELFKSVLGYSFRNGELNGQVVVEGKLEEVMTNLTFPRFMHQSAIIKRNNKWYLVVLGGKSSATINTALETVEALDLSFYLLG